MIQIKACDTGECVRAEIPFQVCAGGIPLPKHQHCVQSTAAAPLKPTERGDVSVCPELPEDDASASQGSSFFTEHTGS